MAERIRPSSSSAFSGLVIENVKFTGVRLGRGADATVLEVDWNGTRCAAKRLHDNLLEDQSAGGVARLVGNFEAECLTWSKLHHPGVVQFLGVHMDKRSRLPVLVMEKMDTSLRTYLEDHSKEEFPLHQKTFVLRQVTQALAYLHSQNPPLVHHDLSSNNVLLNVVSFMTKVCDFGMSRAINPSTFTRKSSIKGTQAFMPPEALHNPPRYNEKLDVFSFGNVILHTLTHEWPDLGPPTRYEGDAFVAVTELQRREQCVELFTAQEKQLFLPIVRQCLENRPDKRPSSVMLVQELRGIELTLPRDVSAHIEHLRQQLSAKVEECRQKDVCERRGSVFQRAEAFQAEFPQIKRRLMRGRYDIGILVVGETGTGKSTLINNLLMKEVVHTGRISLRSETSQISKFNTTVEGVDVVLYDTPGLGHANGADFDEENLKQMKAILDNNEIQLVLYCFKLSETRMRLSLIDAFVAYHKIGVNWEHTVLVLTWADYLPVPYKKRKNMGFQMSQFFNDRVAALHQMISATLVERVGVEQCIVDKIKVCLSASDRADPLPNGNRWFVPLWLDILELVVSEKATHEAKKDGGGRCINQ